METIYLILLFSVSIFALVKGADWFLGGAEKIGLFLGMSPFIVGVTIVSFGTSFPELFTGIMAVLRGVPDIVVANAIGSNIANILLVVGFSALVGGKLVVTKSLVDLDLPLLAAGTVILLTMIFPFGEKGSGATIEWIESLVLIIGYAVYVFYIFLHQEKENELPEEISKEKMGDTATLPTRDERRKHVVRSKKAKKPGLKKEDIILFLTGILFLFFGAHFVIDSAVQLSEKFAIGVGVVSIIAIAIGTTLPELFVSVKAARDNKPEVALGNIFGSNIFNSFIVIGVPGIIGELTLDEKTYQIGVPFLLIATALFVISGISRRIHAYEGAFYLLLYFLFIVKIFGIF